MKDLTCVVGLLVCMSAHVVAQADPLLLQVRGKPDPTARSRKFRLWASGCCHVGTDLRVSKR
jgi:hypothetical protein